MTTKVCIFPEGYDPMVASGPCSEAYTKMSIDWSAEDTQKAKDMEYDVEEVEVQLDAEGKPIIPFRRCYMWITKEEYLKSLPERSNCI